MGKVYILCLLTISSFVLGQKESKDDGNDRCTTDKNNPGYNKIYFPHWNKRVNRPKCDPKEDFGLTFKSTNNFQDCVYIEREWWAIQIMPIGFKPNFNGDFELRALTCKDKDGDESGSAVAHDIYKKHGPGKICMTTTKTSGKKYQVLILAEPKPEEADPRIEFYQSPRFVCENNSCSLEDSEFEC